MGGFTELSDRTIVDWSEKSGVSRQIAQSDASVARILQSIAPVQTRNFIMMDVKGSLIKEERKVLLSRFSNNMFRKVAEVHVGEPTLDFKKRAQDAMLKKRQEELDAEYEQKKREHDLERAKVIAENDLKRKEREIAKELKRKDKEMRKKLEEDRKAQLEKAKAAAKAAAAAVSAAATANNEETT